MLIKVRVEPELWLATGCDARWVRGDAGQDESPAPVFCTESHGADGLTWDTVEQYEDDYTAIWGLTPNEADAADRLGIDL